MEVLHVKNLNFKYESEEAYAVRNVNLGIEKGEMVLFCGPCGCGKTTLFRLLKDELRPAGVLEGKIDNVFGSDSTGYLFQNPDTQIVCRTVEEELVFGAENLAMPREEIARSVAEIAAYLGIEELLHADTTKLSGGQKQMVNLASILLMKPKVLLLDEPASQLDPVSTYEFIQLIRKLKEELELTILIIEHNLDAFLGEADRVIYMEEGQVAYDGQADGLLAMLQREERSFCHSMPETVKTYLEACEHEKCGGNYPLTVRELRRSLEGSTWPDSLMEVNAVSARKEDVAIRVKSGYFRYEKTLPDIVNNLSLTLEKGKIYGLVGGNGAGKSTLFSILSGYRKLYRGKYEKNGKVGILPQNPVYAFFKDVLLEDLEMVADWQKIEQTLDGYRFCSGIRPFLHKNPLDLSGGQMQKAAIVKTLLCDADILLMDEPVKAMDGYEKHLFAALLEELKAAGKTIIFISHDLEFVEKVTDWCLMMFDGRIIAQDTPENMFRNNRFYTTVRGRIRGMMEDERNLY